MSKMRQSISMNDFTKDELQVIQWEINTAINKLNMSSLSCDKHSELNKKIQNMIENYHECVFDMGGWCSVCKGWNVPENNNR